ncbi:uroporphyrinogen decarboxylase [Klugiella xanthotipulae]|uniref:Uroporphyrinogen decarboxylase n=1 Tax=Klugiella xanthotipulae TaxID=244735 RepID=A0A543I620_9MICO|nr:uroporphyrinogen decarboxylase [Klugiella xanthotipulae]TQM65991.1 uroporphyrinogen decarboxylase [Klugiella xanthotipulae]
MHSASAITLDQKHPLVTGATAESRLVRAYQGVRQEVTPVWFMRQAGRSLPEYRDLRVGVRMLDACLDPELSSEITLQPVRRHGVDAGIFFSDIVVPLKLAGVAVEIVPGRGPVFEHPVRSAADVAALPRLDPAALAPVAEGVARTVAELGGTPLIGFAGAPFTLAAYLVEGGPSKDHIRARTLMHADPEAWRALMDYTSELTGQFLAAQIAAGASAAQLFDSWAGSLSRADYLRYVAPASAAALSRVHGVTYSAGGETRTVPLVHFGLVGAGMLPSFRTMGTDSRQVDAVGVDYRTPLDEAHALLGNDVTLQGNIDPALLTAPWAQLEAATRDVLSRGRSARAHVANLGHGVPPETDPTVLTRLVELVHSIDVSGPAAASATPHR